jgi:hypothetical protein
MGPLSPRSRYPHRPGYTNFWPTGEACPSLSGLAQEEQRRTIAEAVANALASGGRNYGRNYMSTALRLEGHRAWFDISLTSYNDKILRVRHDENQAKGSPAPYRIYQPWARSFMVYRRPR